MEHVLITMQAAYSPEYECMCLNVTIDDRRKDVGDPLRSVASFRVELPSDGSEIDVVHCLKYLYDVLCIALGSVQNRMNSAQLSLPNGQTQSLYEM